MHGTVARIRFAVRHVEKPWLFGAVLEDDVGKMCTFLVRARFAHRNRIQLRGSEQLWKITLAKCAHTVARARFAHFEAIALHFNIAKILREAFLEDEVGKIHLFIASLVH